MHGCLTYEITVLLAFCRSARETSKILPFRASLAFLRPVVRLTRVLPTLSVHNILVSVVHVSQCQNAAKGMCVLCVRRFYAYSRMPKVDGALTEYQSFFANGSVFFLRPFLPLERRLFLPTAMVV